MQEHRRLIIDPASEDVVDNEPTAPEKPKFQLSYHTLVVVVAIQTMLLLSIATLAFVGRT